MGFGVMGRAFFDVRIFDPNAQHHEKKTLKRCYKTNEKEKKRNHNSRVFNVEQGSFTGFIYSSCFPHNRRNEKKKLDACKMSVNYNKMKRIIKSC